MENYVNMSNGDKESLLKDVARKSNQDQLDQYDKAYQDELYFGKPMELPESGWLFFICLFCGLFTPILFIALVVWCIRLI